MASGPATATARSDAPAPPRPAWGGRRALTATLCLLAALAVSARADGLDPLRTPGSKQQYLQVKRAWEARHPDGVVALMAPRGTVRLTLMAPQVSGTYKAAQAAKALKNYFDHVSGPALKDVTDKGQRLPRGWAVRKYEYRYTPRGRDPVITLLTITMKGDGRGAWTLNSILETPRPPPEPR